MCDEQSNIVFVRLIEKYPCLYNFNLPEYTRRDVTDSAWANIAQELKCTVRDCKEKWKNLRCVYVRKRNQFKNGTSRKTTRPYYLNRYMDFIDPFVKSTFQAHTQPSFVPSELPIKEEETTDESQTSTAVDPIRSPEEPQVALTEDTSRTLVRKRKHALNVTDTMLSEYADLINYETNFNPRKLFLLSLLPELEELSEARFRIFKRRVLALIDDVTFDPSPGQTEYTAPLSSVQVCMAE